MWGLFGFGIFAIAGTWPLARPLSIAMFHTPEYSLALQLMAVTAVFYGLIEVPMTYVRALERPGLYFAISVARLLLGLTLNLVLVVWLSMGVMGVVYANILTCLITVIGLAGFTFKRTGLGLSQRVLRGMVRFGLPFIPGSLAMLVLHNGDRYILNRFRPLAEVGIYSLGYKLGMIITYAIAVPFANVWSTRMYTVVKEPGGMETYAKVTTYFAYTLLFAWLGLSALAPEVVQIAASREFAGAAIVVPIIAAGYAMREAAECWKNAFMIQKRTAVIGWMQPVIAGANVAITWVLVQKAGALGAAWATLLTFLLMLALTTVLAERVMPTPARFLRMLGAVAIAVGIYAVSRFVPNWPLAIATLVKLALVAVFPFALVVAKVLPPADRAVIGDSINAARRRFARTPTVPQTRLARTRSSLNP
jgi:O-antigen/teichoic acid export membrane protein